MTMPTLQESRTARKLLRNEVPMANVIAHFGNVYDAQTINAGIEHLRAHLRSLAKRDTGFCWKGVETICRVIPPEVLRDRDHRANLRHPNVSAEICGDPLPGYSAADRAPSITPSIHHDPLDDLMFNRRKVGMRYG